MKNLILFVAMVLTTAMSAQEKKQVVEASCGQCKFGMAGKGCELAVRIDGKSYFVDGTSIHDHGDAHSDDGLCSAIRTAEVTGSIVGDRFKATSFAVVPKTAEVKK